MGALVRRSFTSSELAIRKRNRRSLHYAPPDFLSRLVALINFMRFPLGETAHVVVASSAK
jgi:hypothetical protein